MQRRDHEEKLARGYESSARDKARMMTPPAPPPTPATLAVVGQPAQRAPQRAPLPLSRPAAASTAPKKNDDGEDESLSEVNQDGGEPSSSKPSSFYAAKSIVRVR